MCGDPDNRCVFHSTDPATRAKMEQARTRGGQNSQLFKRKKINPPQNIEELSSLMAVVLADLLGNRVSQAQAEVATKLAGVILKSAETADLERRLKELEQKSRERTAEK